MRAFADLIHLPEMINRFGPLPTAWSLERKHKVVKKYGNHLFSQSAPSKSCNWDKSVMRDVTCERLYAIPSDEFDVHPGLLSPTKAPNRELLKALRETFGVSGLWADSFSFRLSRDARLSECSRVSVKDAVVIANGDGAFCMGMLRQLLEAIVPSCYTLFGQRHHLDLLLHDNDYNMEKTFIHAVWLLCRWLKKGWIPEDKGIWVWPPQVPAALS